MNDKAKVIIAVACLVIAGVVIAMQMGLFGSGSEADATEPSDFAGQENTSTDVTNPDGTQTRGFGLMTED